MNVLIAGGGIGGLVTALCLHREGIDVTVFESAPELRELGVGINLLPHAMKQLDRLDLQEELLGLGVELERYMWFNRFGQKIWDDARGRNAGYEWPQLSIDRGRFHMHLVRVVKQRLGQDKLITGHHLQNFEQTDRNITAYFIDRESGEAVGTYAGDVLIGADGIHSVVRKTFYPDEGLPRWNGSIMWRMTVQVDPILGGQTMFSIGNKDIKVVGYEIFRNNRPETPSLLNWIAEVRTGEPGDSPPHKESWNRGSTVEEFIPYFEDWRFDWLDVPALARKTKEAWVFPMVDREPLPRWCFDRVILLGDAAHPMWPIGSNGASQAILDAREITDQLATCSSELEALRAYEKVRLPATTKVVEANRTHAHDKILDIVEERAPNGFNDVSEIASNEELEAIISDYKRTAQFSKEQLQRD